MACACGSYHTITISDDGSAHSFGSNQEGALGLGHNKDVSLPTPIPNLPKINQVSCGFNFTVCVDYEGFTWSFGDNDFGQLGTENLTKFNVPQKIKNIPPVVSVSCGYAHTLIITNYDNLWSCGDNNFEQLCLGNNEFEPLHEYSEYHSKLQKTSFSNISKISAGYYHSLFQNNKGEIFACGYNSSGEFILIILKKHQVSFPMYLKTLFILFVELDKVYFLIQKEMYILLVRTTMAN